MTLSLFDAQLFEKVCNERYKDKTTFTKTDILTILNEMTKSEKYYPRGVIKRATKYKVFKYFVRYCFYRNLANFDSMCLLTGDKGCFPTDEKIRGINGNITPDELGLKNKDIFEIKAYDFQNNKEVISYAQYFNTGRQRVYEIELEDGRKVFATAKHKFFIRRNKKIIEIPLKKIKKTDELVTTDD